MKHKKYITLKVSDKNFLAKLYESSNKDIQKKAYSEILASITEKLP
jgi:hypothetical protein